MIVLTGGPGGGKTTLLDELAADPVWSGRVVVLPEAISFMGSLDLSPSGRSFQKAMVSLQVELEDGLDRALGENDARTVLCHRGSLDPLAYWLDRGWSEDEFFGLTETALQDHYRRYETVIHLVTAADGAEEHYRRWPDAHRPEEAEDAIRLDRLLERVWQGHPHFIRIDNVGRGWQAKSEAARSHLARLISPTKNPA